MWSHVTRTTRLKRRGDLEKNDDGHFGVSRANSSEMTRTTKDAAFKNLEALYDNIVTSAHISPLLLLSSLWKQYSLQRMDEVETHTSSRSCAGQRWSLRIGLFLLRLKTICKFLHVTHGPVVSLKFFFNYEKCEMQCFSQEEGNENISVNIGRRILVVKQELRAFRRVNSLYANGLKGLKLEK